MTLGRANWPLLRETYESLANDMQWKVRRTVASSIHELGVILGEEIAAEDLVPIFDGFIKDLDEVRIGALKHLANFLSLLSEVTRNAYLPRLEVRYPALFNFFVLLRQELKECQCLCVCTRHKLV